MVTLPPLLQPASPLELWMTLRNDLLAYRIETSDTFYTDYRQSKEKVPERVEALFADFASSDMNEMEQRGLRNYLEHAVHAGLKRSRLQHEYWREAISQVLTPIENYITLLAQSEPQPIYSLKQVALLQNALAAMDRLTDLVPAGATIHADASRVRGLEQPALNVILHLVEHHEKSKGERLLA